MARISSFTWKNHVVIVGFNETGLEIAEHFREQQQDVVVIDLDWKLHQVLEASYKDAHRDLDSDDSVHAFTNGPAQQRLPVVQAHPGLFSGQPMPMFPGQPMGYHMLGRSFGAEDVSEEEQAEKSFLASGAAFGNAPYMSTSMPTPSSMIPTMGMPSPTPVMPSSGPMVFPLSSPVPLTVFLRAHAHQGNEDRMMTVLE